VDANSTGQSVSADGSSKKLGSGGFLYCQVGGVEGKVITVSQAFSDTAGGFAPQSYYGGNRAEYYCRLPMFQAKNTTIPSLEMYASFDGESWYKTTSNVKKMPSPSLKEIIAPKGVATGGVYQAATDAYGKYVSETNVHVNNDLVDIATIKGEGFVPGCTCLYTHTYEAITQQDLIFDLFQNNTYTTSRQSIYKSPEELYCSFPIRSFLEKFLVSVACPPSAVSANSIWYVPR
jgi:hypothetical protein